MPANIELSSTPLCVYCTNISVQIEPFDQTDVQERDGWRPLAVIQTQLDGEVSR